MKTIKFIADVDSPSHLVGKRGDVKTFDQDYWAERLVKAGYAIPHEKEDADAHTRSDPEETRPAPRGR
jgi:hypothetical protein